jgi:Putative Zn-dependent protease, contains TPR repeats
MKVGALIRFAPEHPGSSGSQSKRALFLVCLAILYGLWAIAGAAGVGAQNNYAIWGELRIRGGADAPSGATIILYKSGGSEVGRQSISSGGRYRFTNLSAGEYDVTAEVEEKEIARMRVPILERSLSPFYGFRQDFDFEWKSKSAGANPKVISANDSYTRSAANQSLFNKAEHAVSNKKYDEAIGLLQLILDNDKADFQVWSLLGTVYLVEEKFDDAEKAYTSALAVRPSYTLALLNLAKLRLSKKKFEEAIEPLTRVAEQEPPSGEANLLLGECYLQLKKGSKAVVYLNEAARLGKPEAHLRLAWLYDAAGMKDKAAVEYQEFLKKKPDYPDRKRLEQYINANRKV